MIGGNTMKTSKTHRKKEPNEALEDDTDECLFEFTDLGPHLTGLPFFVWVRPSMGLRREVWVGVSPDRNNWGGCDLIQVAIRPEVRVVKGKMSNKKLSALRQWVELNQDMIVKYWDCDPMTQDSVAVYDAVKSLPLKGKANRLASNEGRYARSEEILRAFKPLPRPN
jgi:hypothetical protein